jgi:hypothetical protein
MENTIIKEATDKLNELIVSVNKKFDTVTSTSLLLNRVKLDTNKDIHNFVKSTTALRKAIDPVLKYNAPKLEARRGRPILRREDEIIKVIDTLNFTCTESKDSFKDHLLKSLN